MKNLFLYLSVFAFIGCTSCQELDQILESETTGSQETNTGTNTGSSSSSTSSPADLEPYRTSGHELSANGNVYRDIPYASDEKNNYDLILPKNMNDRTAGVPLVIFFHGGGFIQGNKNTLYKKTSVMKEMQAYLNNGIAVANVNYRLLQQNENQGVIKCLSDAKHVVQSIKAGSGDSGIDPNKIVLRGTSAGGSIALWVALHDDMGDKSSDDPVAKQSTRVAGAVVENVQSTLDITKWEEVFKEYGYKYNENLDAEMKARLYGMYGESTPSGDLKRGEFESKTASYRKDVDFSSFMDANDPPIMVANKPKLAGAPTQKNLLFHHRDHAKYLEDQSEKVGGAFHQKNAFYYLTDPKVKDITDYVKGLVN